MDFDLILRTARLADDPARLLDIGIRSGRFAALDAQLAGDGPEEDLGGRLVIPGFVETHLHLDKSAILDRCPCGNSLRDAIAAVSRAKRDFTEADVYVRASRTLEKAILQGTNRIRTHVEVDPRVGLTSLRALLALKRDYAWAVDLSLCAFPQEGLLDDPGCDAVLVEAMESGADLIGGAPYVDRDPAGQIARIFELAQQFDVDIDLHLDFDLDPSRSDLEAVCRATDAAGWGGRVAIGHVTKLSAVPADALAAAAQRLASAGVALTALPATDLFLNGRNRDHDVPRGVAPVHRLRAMGVICSLSTNNVLNPFTPFGDCSLLRLANLYANVAQVGDPAGLEACFAMVTEDAARLLGSARYAIASGAPADFIVLDATSKVQCVAEIAAPLAGYRAGARTFSRPLPTLQRPVP